MEKIVNPINSNANFVGFGVAKSGKVFGITGKDIYFLN